MWDSFSVLFSGLGCVCLVLVLGLFVVFVGVFLFLFCVPDAGLGSHATNIQVS